MLVSWKGVVLFDLWSQLWTIRDHQWPGRWAYSCLQGESVLKVFAEADTGSIVSKLGGQIHCFPTKMEHLKGQSGGYHVLWCRELGYSNTNSMIIYLWSSMRGDSTVFEKVISCHSCHPRYVQSLDSEGLKFGICSSICIFNLEIQLVFISLHFLVHFLMWWYRFTSTEGCRESIFLKLNQA